MDQYQYEILNYWNDDNDIYVNYIIYDLVIKQQVNTIDCFNILDMSSDANTDKLIKNELLNLIKKNKGKEFSLPKVTEISPLLRYVYDGVCESESNMCHIDYNDWEELKEENDFVEEDVKKLKSEIQKYNIEDYITIDEDGYKICGYGCLQCCFNDNRKEKINYDALER